MATKGNQKEVTVYCLEDESVTKCSRQGAELLKLTQRWSKADLGRLLKLMRAMKDGRFALTAEQASAWTKRDFRLAVDALS